MEPLIESLTCSLDLNGGGRNGFLGGNKHFLDNPKYLPCCRRKACNACIIKHLTRRRHSTATQADVMFVCPWCVKNTRVSVTVSSLVNGGHQEVNLDPDEAARDEYERNLNEINMHLIRKLDSTLKNIEDRLTNKEKLLDKRREHIESEIHNQVESLKAHLDAVEVEMKANLAQSTQNMLQTLEKFEKTNQSRLDDMKVAIENLRTNATKRNSMSGSSDEEIGGKRRLSPKLSMALQHQSVNSCVESLAELNKINKSISEVISELRFEPNADFSSAADLIGNLKEVNEPNLKELFKTVKSHAQITRMSTLPGSPQPMPISPRYMCAADPSTMLFTDSQTKQLVHVKLDTGELVRSTNLAGQLKNPDGVCVNPVTGSIYVSDSELKILFKLDYQFNVVKKFGYRDLKWPRGNCLAFN